MQGEPALRFESRRARALLAYLCLESTPVEHERSRLSSLFWPDADETSARQNLRQAIYNLRNVLQTARAGSHMDVVVTTRHTVGLRREAGLWVDVHAFQEGVRLGSRGSLCVNPQRLAEAVQLYRGELLAGFSVEDSPELEEWLLVHQERLRSSVLLALDALVDHHRERGELQQATLFARRRVELDQLSEAAHRSLIQLFAMAGDRSRAVAQFEQCRLLLQLELGVEPLVETRALYDAVLASEVTDTGAAKILEPSAPVLPLVGRRAEYAALRQAYARVCRGASRLTLITGGEGFGKTRLVRSFLHEITAREETTVVLACAHPRPLPICYETLAELLRSASQSAGKSAAALQQELGPGVVDALRPINPQLFPGGGRDGRIADRNRLTGAVTAYLRALPRRGTAGGLVVFVDDIHWCDPPSAAVLLALVPALRNDAVWFVSSYRPQELPPDHPFRQGLQALRAEALCELVALETLTASDLRQLCATLLTGRDADELASLLTERAMGVPLAIAEWINLLCDEGILAQAAAARWALSPSLREWAESAPADLDAVISRRINRLPASTRRLLALAAVIGETFDVSLLARAAGEHRVVLEHGLETLLGRWLARHAPLAWFASRRERDLVLWNQGARRGSFGFAHKLIRRVVYNSMAPERRSVMHREIAEILQRLAQEGEPIPSEEIAIHLRAAGDWPASARALAEGAARAHSLGESEVALGYYDAALASIRRARDAGQDDDSLAALAREITKTHRALTTATGRQP